MHQNNIFVMYVVIGILVLMNIQFSDAFCCANNLEFGCCATGPCNFFCCNCDGECVPNCPGMALTKSNPELKFEKADKNLDGTINKAEAITYLISNGHNSTELENDSKWFDEMDKNGDGLLEKKEIGI